MEFLSKEQKLAIISKALDMGFKVDLIKHHAQDKDVVQGMEVFDGFTCGYDQEGNARWVKFYAGYENKLNAVFFLEGDSSLENINNNLSSAELPVIEDTSDR